MAACERKKESHDEKAKRQADIKRDIEKLEQENRSREIKARVLACALLGGVLKHPSSACAARMPPCARDSTRPAL